MKSTINKKLLGVLVFFMLLLVGFFTYKAICSPDYLMVNTFKIGDGWGYDITYQEKVVIHQDLVPCIQGRYVFKSESDARKTARLIIKKIRKEGFPPNVSVDEIEELNVEYIILR